MNIDMNLKIVNKNWGEPAEKVAHDFLSAVGIAGDVEVSGDDRIGFATITSNEDVESSVGNLASRSDVIVTVCRELIALSERAMIVTVNIKAHAEGSTSCLVTTRNKDIVVTNINGDKIFPCSTLSAENIVSWA